MSRFLYPTLWVAMITLAIYGITTGYPPYEAPAVEARYIGLCNGRMMAAMEESAFPASGCTWIEPIRYEGEPAQ